MMWPTGALRLAFAVCLTAVGGVWWHARGLAPLNVVVVTLDTTRADRLSPYGFMNVSLPNLERLAREGVIFDEASTAVPLTLPAHASLFTGLLPPHHGVRDNAGAPLSESQTTLAETLAAWGFRTGAFVSSIVLNPDRGLRQGFEVYHGVEHDGPDARDERQRRGDQVVDDAVRWLDAIGDSRFLLWAHLYDAHRPYDPPEPYRSTYGHDLYLGEIAFADAQIGRLLDALERRHVLDRTIVVVAGDHGESLGEHGERDHGVFVYESVLHVPLIIRAPALAPARVGCLVRLIDVMPTVLDLLRVPAPATDGVSLRDVMTGRRADLHLDAYSESMYPERLGWSSLRAVREGRYKMIDAPRPELYDLDEDPFEDTNIYATRRAIAETLALKIAAASGPAGDGAGATSLTPEEQRQLGSLGYLATAVPADRNPARARPDPKDCIGHGAVSGESSLALLSCGWKRSAEALVAGVPTAPPHR